MADKNLYKKLILEYQQFAVSMSYIPRNISVDLTHCNVFVGLRRSGKTFLMYQCIGSLMESGMKKEEVLFINFEDDRIPSLSLSDLDIFKTCYEEMFETRPVFFLDEIQQVKGWEKFARRLADTGYKVFITGSNASMLSMEIASVLGGRYALTEVYPFSFTEYLEAKGVKLEKGWQYLRESEIKRNLTSYLNLGGLPEIPFTPPEFQRKWISNLFDRIYFGDIVTRYGVRKPEGLRTMIRKLVESVGQPLSINRISSIISSAGSKIRMETVAEYLDYARNTWLIFSIENYEGKLAEKISNLKYYFIDNAFLTLFKDEDMDSRLLENMVAVTLRRIHGEKIYFYKRNVEIDFYIPDVSAAVQVSWSLDNETTRKRELSALELLHEHHPLKKAVVVTYDSEDDVTLSSGLEVHIRPLWKWLIEEK